MNPSQSTEALLEIEDLYLAYGPTEVLHGVSLVVRPGEIVSLIGSNGAGKTTLLKSLFGMPRAKQGRIFFLGEQLGSIPTHKIASRGLSLVPEGRHIFPAMSVLENLKMGLTARPTPVGSDDDLHRIFELFPRLLERSSQRAGTLSGGALRRVAREGMTIFLVEQNANQALRLADRAYVLTNGRITLTGHGPELLAHPEVQKAYLGG
ncbi:MAG: ABC transporter ATP-binding protein [Proteobacteria bacterium]|nr:ABC transporter ATP-binding protein [Pseudomonadota bacterium]